jgi:AP-4 complex subunit epsilon-1
MPSSLPPYLTSGASSRSHHALLVKLHEAKSDQEEADVTSKEIERLKDVMSVKGQSTV